MAYKSKYFQEKYGRQEETSVTSPATTETQYKSKYFQAKYGSQVMEQTIAPAHMQSPTDKTFPAIRREETSPEYRDYQKSRESAATNSVAVKTSGTAGTRSSAARDSGVRRSYANRDQSFMDIETGLNDGEVRVETSQREMERLYAEFCANPSEDNAKNFAVASSAFQAEVDAYNDFVEQYNYSISSAGLQERTEAANRREKEARQKLSEFKLANYVFGRPRDREAAMTGESLEQDWRDAKAKAKQLSGMYYYAENREKQQALQADADMSGHYGTVQDLQGDLDKLNAVMAYYSSSGTGDPATIMEYQKYLEEKYGLDQRALDAYSVGGAYTWVEPGSDGGYNNVYELVQMLEDQQQASVAALKSKDFDYARMAEYEQMLKDAETYKQRSLEWEAYAKEHPFWASVNTIAVAPAQGLDYLRAVARGIGRSDTNDLENYVPLNVYTMDATNFVSTVRGTVSKEIEANTNWEILGQNVASFLYQTGMSIGDSAYNIAIFGTFAPYVMGGSAAASQTRDVILRGGTNEQAILSGLAAGAAEMIFERFSVEKLMSIKNVSGWRAVLEATAKQMGAEASEEGFTEIANILSDVAIMGESSEYKQLVQHYMRTMSEEEANRQAFLDMVTQVTLASAGGAISGFAMGGTKSTISAIATGAEGKSPAKAQPQTVAAQAERNKATGVTAIPEAKTAQGAAERSVEEVTAQSVADLAAKSFGSTGQKAFATTLNEVAPDTPWGLFGGFSAYYQAGMTGKDIHAVKSTYANDLPISFRQIAYDAGAQDAAASLQARSADTDSTIVHNDGQWVIENEYSETMNKDDVQVLSGVAQAIGKKVIFEDLGSDNGYYDADSGIIHLDIHAEDPLLDVMAHEVTHVMEDMAPVEHGRYRDFVMNAMAERLGIDTSALIAGKKAEYANGGRTLSDEQAMNELVAEYTKQMMKDRNLFEAYAKKDLTGARKLLEAFKRFLQKVKSLFKGNRQAQDAAVRERYGVSMEVAEEAARLWDEALNAVVVQAKGENKNTTHEGGGQKRHSFKGYDKETGRGIYESNFPIGTPKSAKAQRILELIQTVWSKKPIDLVIENKDGSTRTIQAQFDPTYDSNPHVRTDASKLMGGNRHGTAAEQRVTLSLADDYYQIATDASYNYSKDELGKQSDTHKGVKQWHYFVNDILFQEQGEEKMTPYRVTINVKERSDGHFVYSFSAEKQKGNSNTRQTLHADVTPPVNGGGNVRASDIKLTENGSRVKSETVAEETDDLSMQNGGEVRASAKRNQPGYNAFRTLYAKEGLDDLSRKLGDLFPLSANFETAIRKDDTPLSNVTITARSTVRNSGEGFYAAARRVIRAKYAKGTKITIGQIGVDTRIDLDFAKESLSKVHDNTDKQIVLDIIPYMDDLLRGSRLLAVERVRHTDNKKTTLFCYRLYNAYQRIEPDVSRKQVTRQHAVVFTIIQNLSDAGTYLVTDIKSIAPGKGRIATNSKSPHTQGDALVSTIADLYDVVKRIPRKDGGLLYTQSEELTYKFDYTETNDGKRYSRKGATALDTAVARAEEAEALKQQIAYWKGQLKRTKGFQVDQKAVNKVAKGLIRTYQVDTDADELSAKLKAMYDGIATGYYGDKEIDYETFKGRAEEVARLIVENAVETENEMYVEYAELRKYLRSITLNISHEDSQDIPDFGDFRKRNWGRMTIGSKGTNIDQVYKELSELWPEFFSEERETTPSDQLLRIAEVMEAVYRSQEVNPFGQYAEEAVSDIADEVMGYFFTIPQAVTFADKAAAKLKQATADAKLAGQMAQGRKDAALLRSTEERMAAAQQRAKDALRKERERGAKAMQDLKDRQSAKDTRTREQRKAAELRGKIVRHAKALSKKLLSPTDKKHVPDELQSAVAAVLDAINLESKWDSAEKTTKRTQAFQKLRDAYKKVAGDVVVDPALFSGDGDQAATGPLLEAVLDMGDTRIADMGSEQLTTVWQVLKAVEASVRSADRLLASKKYQHISEMADQFQSDNALRRPKKGGKRGSKMLLDLEIPKTFFHKYGEIGDALFRVLRNAQDNQQRMTDEIAEAVKAIVTPKQVQEMQKDVHEVKTEGGDTLYLTTAHIMELYLLSKREQAQDHLLKGGIVQPEIQSKKIQRGTDMIRLSMTDISSITGKLTQEQTRIADALQQLMTTKLADYGNAASMTAYGYKKFTGKDYWPIKSAQEALHSKVEKGANNTRSIKNIGLAQQVVPHANTALNLGGIFQTFSGHATDMIDYAAWLCPMEDVNRLFNFKYKDGKGIPTGKTVKGILDRVGGSGSQAYWSNLMEDIQNGIAGPGDTSIGNLAAKITGSVKGASVGANVRVIVQQPTAIVRAVAVMKPAYLARGGRGVTKGSGWKKALKYAEIAQRKNRGGFEISNPMQMSEILFDDQTSLARFNDAMQKGAAAADALTWGCIWNACEHQVKHETKLEVGTEAFYKKVAEVFTEVIEESQVVDGVLQRSQIMRSANQTAKQMTSFMGEPTMSLNMLLRAYDAWRYEQNGAKKAKAGRTLARVGATLVATDLITALAQSLVDAIRDDDKEKKYWERFWKAFTGLTGDEETFWERVSAIYLSGNAANTASVIGKLPYAKDIKSLVQGYSVERLDISGIADLINAGETVLDNLRGEGARTWPYTVKQLATAGSKLFGISASNILRDVWGIARSVAVETGSIEVQYEMEKAIYKIANEKNKGKFYDILFSALKQGDMENYNIIRRDLMTEMGLAGTDIDSAMKSRYNKALEKDPGMSFPQEAADTIGIVTKYDHSKPEEKFGADDLDATAYQAYSRQLANERREIMDGLEADPIFRGEDGEFKDAAISAAEKLVKEQALEDHSDGQYEVTAEWIKYAEEAEAKGIEPCSYVLFHAAYTAIVGKGKSDKIRDWLEDNRTLTESQREFLWGTVYKSEW